MSADLKRYFLHTRRVSKPRRTKRQETKTAFLLWDPSISFLSCVWRCSDTKADVILPEREKCFPRNRKTLRLSRVLQLLPWQQVEFSAKISMVLWSSLSFRHFCRTYGWLFVALDFKNFKLYLFRVLKTFGRDMSINTYLKSLYL